MVRPLIREGESTADYMHRIGLRACESCIPSPDVMQVLEAWVNDKVIYSGIWPPPRHDVTLLQGLLEYFHLDVVPVEGAALDPNYVGPLYRVVHKKETAPPTQPQAVQDGNHDDILVSTCELRFEKRIEENRSSSHFGSIHFVLQKMYWRGQKQVWIDVPTVEQPPPGSNP